jgi:polar amino acid transport system substrate-binding protein
MQGGALSRGRAATRTFAAMRTRPNILATAVLTLTLAMSAGCGSGDDSDNATPAASTVERTLTVAADATYPPNEFLGTDGKTVIGMSADLGEAIGKAMGVRMKFVNAPFDGILPGLAAGKYDIGFSSFTDTKEREQTVDFVTYYSAGTSFFVRAEDGPQIETLADLCGHTISVQKGTVQADYAAEQADKCRSGGEPALKVLVLPDQPAANLALGSGRADVTMADSPVAAYQVKKSDGRFKLVGEPYGAAPYGIAVPKGSDLTKPLLRAVESIMRDGSYDAVLRKWGLQLGAIDDPTVNGAID